MQEDVLYKDYDWLYYQNITLNKTFVQISKEFNYNVSTLKKWASKLKIPKKGTGYFNIGKTPWNKGLSEVDDTRIKRQSKALREYHYDSSKKGEIIMKENTSKYQKYLKESCEICNCNEDLEVHHKDKNRLNNYPTNLLTVCSSCHQKIHNQSLTIIHSDKILSIQYIGEEEVYDLEMDNYHNYIANGIVVHNCNYSKDKFGNEITFVLPAHATKDSEFRNIICGEFKEAESYYFNLLSIGMKPQDARCVLPTALKTEIIMTGFLKDWGQFITLRTKPNAHPDIQKLANEAANIMANNNFIIITNNDLHR